MNTLLHDRYREGYREWKKKDQSEKQAVSEQTGIAGKG